jgi:hypothetical protein
MKRQLGLIAAVAGLALAVGGQGAAATTHLSGGGTASVGGTAFSQVAMNVSFDGSGTASGSFNCLMAGRSKGVLGALFGLSHIMKVQATPTAGAISGSTATFSGPGMLIMDGGQHMAITISVWVNVATQQFQLTVIQVGALPVETFSSGGVALR